MAKLKKKFDSSKHGDMQTLDVLPKGEYPMQIIESAYDENSRKTGNVLKMVYEVMDHHDLYAKRKLFVNMNLENQNKTAQEIAEREFASLNRAIFGTDYVVEDTEELHGIPFLCKVTIRKSREDGEQENHVVGYAHIPHFEDGPTGKKDKKGKKNKKDKKGKK